MPQPLNPLRDYEPRPPITLYVRSGEVSIARAVIHGQMVDGWVITRADNLPHVFSSDCHWCNDIRRMAMHAQPVPCLPADNAEDVRSCNSCAHFTVCVHWGRIKDRVLNVPSTRSIVTDAISAILDPVAKAVAPHCAEYTDHCRSAQYDELIMAVGKCFPGESRHQTALRYIRRAEEVVSGPDMDATPKP